MPTSPTEKPRRRRWWLLLVVVPLVLLGIPASFVVRGVFFAPKFDVASIATTPHYQDAARLGRLNAQPVAASYGALRWQTNGSKCGPASLANVLRSLGRGDATEDAVLDQTGLCWTGVCFGGVTLDELADVARRRDLDVEVLRDLDLATFRKHMVESARTDLRYVVNFQRGMLFGKGTGHHSPIGGYLPDEDLVLVLDVNQKFGPWLATTERLFAAVDTIDGSSGKKRGLLRLIKR